MSSHSGKKLRRAHTKSRNGCLRCKRQRKKCDEYQPRCGRCDELDIDCHYAKRKFLEELEPSRTSAVDPEPSSRSLRRRSASVTLTLHAPGESDSDNQPGWASTSVTSPRISDAFFDVLPSSEASWSMSPTMGVGGSEQQQQQQQQQCGLPPPLPPPPQPSLDILDKQDLELFSHYLSHTSRTIPFDKTDAYALQVGFPNLAFGNQPLMSSILALAAACRCHDLLEHHQKKKHHPGTLLPLLDRVRDLLAVAEQHHKASLRQIQEAIPTAERYDCILASAALMVLYGSASHCVRIRAVDMYHHHVHHHKGSSKAIAGVPADMVPVHSQWIDLIRAVHLAYVGLVAADGAAQEETTTLQNNTTPPPCLVVVTEPEPEPEPVVEAVSCPQDGPTDDTRRLFLPIVASTSGSAMSRLRARASRIGGQASTSSSSSSKHLQACWEALVMLERTMDCVLVEGNNAPGASSSDEETYQDEEVVVVETTPEPSLPEELVAPWLRVYIARVTSNNNSNNNNKASSSSRNPLRRSVNAFLNRVPASYVALVQTALECFVPVDGGMSDHCDTTACLQGEEEEEEENTVAHRLAVDIFAHWLVFTLLLDGVWWIGEIGSWELGRAVAFMRDRRSRVMATEEGEEKEEEEEVWWPESMYKIRTELKKHAR